MTKYRSINRIIFLIGAGICLISSLAWAAPNAGSLAAWGYNCCGQTNLPAGNNFITITAGYFHSLALRSDGSLAGWGRNVEGQTNVPSGNDFVAIAAGAYFGLALKSDGSLAALGHE